METLYLLSSLALASTALAQRTITVYNACPFTICWEAGEYTAVTFQVPSDWTAGRIWGRRDCDFTTDPGPNSCLDGGCNGGLVCDPTTGTGVPPASLAEFTLGAGGVDYFDVSLVDGYNLPVSVTNNVGCGVPSCPVDLGPDCPAALQGPYDSTGFPVGCKSACEADLDGDPTNSPNCCSGQYDTPATCPSSGVEYYSYFSKCRHAVACLQVADYLYAEDNCPDAYAYAYDDATSLFTCSSSLNAEFTITFCP
ncbi:thaumatin [Suillus subaureus]|uniref:Thaumatin n=1 Tax=Suillus subaureus TaxID=48587 RepID=A0A9P7EJR1_9AGAM|nr:thaumatin [Suillus subaureus]KAG1823700.1 thaumatin [Suillus subaureus]